MKKNDIFPLVQLYLAPVLVILLGVLLLINPDSASVLISLLLGGILTILGIVVGVGFLFGARKPGKLVMALGLLAAGSILSRNPLLLASFAGRIIGLLLLVDGIGDLVNARRQGIRGLMPLVVTVLGAVLTLMPMSASRLVFSLCGLLVAIVGVMMLLDRIRRRRLPGGDKDRKIIDAL